MKKWILGWSLLVLVLGAGAQTPDSVKVSERKMKWLVGVDALSDLNFVSVIGGIESNRSRYSLSLSSLSGSTRIGVYYDYYLTKKYRILIGAGFHNSFVFKDFNRSRQVYADSLEKFNLKETGASFAYVPSWGEVRHLYFFTAYLGKEFKLYKGLYLNLKIEGICCINPFYHNVGIVPYGGLQFYYKW